MLGSGIKGFSSSGEEYSLTFIMKNAIAAAKTPSVGMFLFCFVVRCHFVFTRLVSLTSPRNNKVDTSGKFCKECGAKANNEEQKACRTCGTAFPVVTSRGPQVQVDTNALLANKK
jgi:ribosomal protein L37E